MDILHLLSICIYDDQLLVPLYAGKEEVNLVQYRIGIDIHSLLIASGEWIRTGRKGIVDGTIPSLLYTKLAVQPLYRRKKMYARPIVIY